MFPVLVFVNNTVMNMHVYVLVFSSFVCIARRRITRLYSNSGGSDGKESACNTGDLGSSPGGEHGNPLQYSCLENPHGQRSLKGYSPWGHKESDTTEQLGIAYSNSIFNF